MITWARVIARTVVSGRRVPSSAGDPLQPRPGARAGAFYASLGFRETFRVPVDGDPIHVDLALDGYTIGIASVASTRDDHGLDPVAEGQRAAVILWTNDVRTAYQTLVDAGADALAAPHRRLERLLIAWVADPDGNPVQIVQRLDD